MTLSSLDAVEASLRHLCGEHPLPFALDGIPEDPMYKLSGEAAEVGAQALAMFLKNVAVLHWATCLFASSVKAVVQRSQDTGIDWVQTDKEWEKMLLSLPSVQLIERFASFFQSSLFEVCRNSNGRRVRES